MKLSEMSTQQMAACLCRIAEPLSRIGKDERINAYLSEAARASRANKTQLQLISEMLGEIVPVVLGTRFDDAVTVISAMTGKDEQTVREQRGMQTLADVREFLDGDFFSFFRSSAASTPEP